jgi:hypothetical protein
MHLKMPSPFPGMDPYLERTWRDVQGALVAFAREHLNRVLPGGLVARGDYREDAGGEKDRYLRVMSGDDGDELTRIEFVFGSTHVLSAEDAGAVSGNARNRFSVPYNTLAIFLSRSADWTMTLRPHDLPEGCRTPYGAWLRDPRFDHRLSVWPISLRDPLPVLPVPLPDLDGPVPLPLQELLDRVYDTGRYAATDYRRECVPPLAQDDATWADQLLRQAGRRCR